MTFLSFEDKHRQCCHKWQFLFSISHHFFKTKKFWIWFINILKRNMLQNILFKISGVTEQKKIDSSGSFADNIQIYYSNKWNPLFKTLFETISIPLFTRYKIWDNTNIFQKWTIYDTTLLKKKKVKVNKILMFHSSRYEILYPVLSHLYYYKHKFFHTQNSNDESFTSENIFFIFTWIISNFIFFNTMFFSLINERCSIDNKCITLSV